MWVLNYWILKLEVLNLFSSCSYKWKCLDAEVSQVFLQILTLLKYQIGVVFRKAVINWCNFSKNDIKSLCNLSLFSHHTCIK